jgi:hypothetical protein
MPSASDSPSATPRLGAAWVGLCFALGLHVADEALSGFLSVYNPSVLELRARYAWFPMPVFGFTEWLTGLIALIIVMFLLSPLFFQGVRWVRPIGWFMAVLNTFNALGHTAGTIAGRTVASIHFPRPMPGFYSSPFLLAASLYLLVQLARTSRNGSA